MKIATMCVSYGRPDRALECFKSWKSTQSGLASFWLVLDENDPQKTEYYGLDWEGANYIITPTMRRGMCDPSNHGAMLLADKYNAIQFMADDFLYRTPNWDLEFQKHNKSVIIWYGNDLLQGANLPTSFIISSNIVLELGYICNPKFQHLYIDNWIKQLGIETNTLVYDKDVIIEHMHPGANKAQWDNGYLAVQSCESGDRNVYQQWLETDMHLEKFKINNLIKN